jgi:hypothetical protein
VKAIETLTAAAAALALAAAPAAQAAGTRSCNGDNAYTVTAVSTVSCPFAINVENAWFNTCHNARRCVRHVRSPVTKKIYKVTCIDGGAGAGHVLCTGRHRIRMAFRD